MSANEILIEVVKGELGGGPVEAVRVRHGETWIETPWLIGAAAACARDIATKIRARYPGAVLVCKGFDR
jgi:hypothetical protein